MHLLLELLALLCYTLISHCLITWRVYLLNKLIGVWLKMLNVVDGIKKDIHALMDCYLACCGAWQLF